MVKIHANVIAMTFRQLDRSNVLSLKSVLAGARS